jgi:hypothetical protein
MLGVLQICFYTNKRHGQVFIEEMSPGPGEYENTPPSDLNVMTAVDWLTTDPIDMSRNKLQMSIKADLWGHWPTTYLTRSPWPEFYVFLSNPISLPN